MVIGGKLAARNCCHIRSIKSNSAPTKRTQRLSKKHNSIKLWATCSSQLRDLRSTEVCTFHIRVLKNIIIPTHKHTSIDVLSYITVLPMCFVCSCDHHLKLLCNSSSMCSSSRKLVPWDYFCHTDHNKMRRITSTHAQTPMPVAARSKEKVCGRSLALISGLNPAGGIDACLLWMLRVVR
jgi:hypothetical protein